MHDMYTIGLCVLDTALLEWISVYAVSEYEFMLVQTVQYRT